MAEPENKPDAPPPTPPGPSSKADLAALGVGCLVFVLFFVAIALVGMMRE